MKRKVQVRRHKTSILTQPLHTSMDQPRLQMAEAGGIQSESATYMPATEAKNRFAAVLDNVSKGQEVFITKHNAPKAVIISVERFRALSAATTSMLDRLTAEFDARLAKMQTVKARSSLERAFNASPTDLGRAALKAARSHS